MGFLVVGSYMAQKLKLSQALGNYLSDDYIYGHDSDVKLNLSYRDEGRSFRQFRVLPFCKAV